MAGIYAAWIGERQLNLHIVDSRDGVLYDTKEKKPVSDKPTKVRVSDRWQVIHDGKPYTKGDTLTVPEHLAEEWDRSRWVERVTQRT